MKNIMKCCSNVEIYELKSDLKGKAYYYKDSQTLTIHFEERHAIYEDIVTFSNVSPVQFESFKLTEAPNKFMCDVFLDYVAHRI
jgi:hypothetical protein